MRRVDMTGTDDAIVVHQRLIAALDGAATVEVAERDVCEALVIVGSAEFQRTVLEQVWATARADILERARRLGMGEFVEAQIVGQLDAY